MKLEKCKLCRYYHHVEMLSVHHWDCHRCLFFLSGELPHSSSCRTELTNRCKHHRNFQKPKTKCQKFLDELKLLVQKWLEFNEQEGFGEEE